MRPARAGRCLGGKMSTKYKHGDIVPTEVLAARLHELAHVVTAGPDAVRREFVMRVPAELDYDADLVLSQAAARLRGIVRENETNGLLQMGTETLAKLCEDFTNAVFEKAGKER